VEGAKNITTLAEIPAGGQGKIVEITTENRRILGKLASLGIVPGALFRVVRQRPAVILQLGYTRVAIDPVLAQHIQADCAG
jgi:Fe2+ transport system protein FeoA